MLKQETETAWCPDWYVVIQAAKYLGCTPVEMIEMPIFWKNKALIAMTAEYEAAEINRQHQ